jgi:hypothetical protein
VNADKLKRIKKRIARLKAELRKEKRMFGWYDDSSGRRYLIPELYLEIKDYQNIIIYYDWFYGEFPDDIGFPELHLCWIIAGIHKKKPEMYQRHLVELEGINGYIIPLLLEQEVLKLEKWEGMSISTLDYAREIHTNFAQLLDAGAREELARITGESRYLDFKNRLGAIDQALLHEKPGPERENLLRDRNSLLQNWFAFLGTENPN